mmetsp:Transcript_5763/g.13276  ORF Transcript_5763/g.13276 Transcript_5763/m.13276 type:complete len:275 (+) Transcript_5763:178-1002(+)
MTCICRPSKPCGHRQALFLSFIIAGCVSAMAILSIGGFQGKGAKWMSWKYQVLTVSYTQRVGPFHMRKHIHREPTFSFMDDTDDTTDDMSYEKFLRQREKYNLNVDDEESAKELQIGLYARWSFVAMAVIGALTSLFLLFTVVVDKRRLCCEKLLGILMLVAGVLCVVSASYWWDYWSDTFGDDDLVNHIKTCALDCKLGLGGGFVAVFCGVMVLVFSNLVPYFCSGCYDGTAVEVPLTGITMTGVKSPIQGASKSGGGGGGKGVAKNWPPARA